MTGSRRDVAQVKTTSAGGHQPEAVNPVGGNQRLRWLAANLLGFLVGGALFGAIQRHQMQPYFEVLGPGGRAALIIAINTGLSLTIFGAVVGVAQGAALFRGSGALRWAVTTCLGWGLSGVILGYASGATTGTRDHDVSAAQIIAGVVAVSVGLGLVPSMAQWVAMRRFGFDARWPATSTVALMLGLIVGFLVVRWGLVHVITWLTPEDFPSAKVLILVGGVTGTVYGAMTGRYLKGTGRHRNPPEWRRRD
jgi:hypothetical protein